LRADIERLTAMGVDADDLRAVKRELAKLETRLAGSDGEAADMKPFYSAFYAAIVWLIYFKFKWLPWTTPHKVTSLIIPDRRPYQLSVAQRVSRHHRTTCV